MSVGQLLLAKGDVEQAFNTFKIVLDGDPDNVPALLGQVFVISIYGECRGLGITLLYFAEFVDQLNAINLFLS